MNVHACRTHQDTEANGPALVCTRSSGVDSLRKGAGRHKNNRMSRSSKQSIYTYIHTYIHTYYTDACDICIHYARVLFERGIHLAFLRVGQYDVHRTFVTMPCAHAPISTRNQTLSDSRRIASDIYI